MFFLRNNEVYPGQWDSLQLWEGEGKYKDLRLFDQNGNFLIDPEGLKLLGLLHEDFREFKVCCLFVYCAEVDNEE